MDHLPEKILPLIVRSRPGTSQPRVFGTAGGQQEETQFKRLIGACSANVYVSVQTLPRAPEWSDIRQKCNNGVPECQHWLPDTLH